MTIIVYFEVWSLAWIIPQKKHLLYRWVVTADNMLPYFVYSHLSGKSWDWAWLSSFPLQSQRAKITSQECLLAFGGIFYVWLALTQYLCDSRTVCAHVTYQKFLGLLGVTQAQNDLSVCPEPLDINGFFLPCLPIQQLAQVAACAQQSLAGSPSLQLVKATVCTPEWFLATAGPGPKLVI